MLAAGPRRQDGLVSELEESTRLALDFSKLDAVATTGALVVPVILQEADSGEVLFIGYANEEALQVSLRERIAVLWSTTPDPRRRGDPGAPRLADFDGPAPSSRTAPVRDDG